jgi:hypothetical protein
MKDFLDELMDAEEDAGVGVSSANDDGTINLSGLHGGATPSVQSEMIKDKDYGANIPEGADS